MAIFNLKGGVGKTTTAVNIASGLAREGKKVLLMDMDAQGSIMHCLKSEYPIKDMFHLIGNSAELQECLTHMGKNIDVVLSNGSLNDIDEALQTKVNKKFQLSLKMENNKDYDYVIMDCPPNFGIMTKNSFIYADEVIVPVSTDILGYKVLKSTTDTIKAFNKEHPDDKVELTKIIPTLYDKRLKVSKEILTKIQSEFYGIVSNPIMVNSKLKEAPKKKCSIFSYAKNSQGAKDYKKLTTEFLHTEKQEIINFESQEAGAIKT